MLVSSEVMIRSLFLNWPFNRGKGLLMKIFFPYLRRKEFRFELKNGVTIPGQPIDEYITKWMFIHGYDKEYEYAMTHRLIRPGDVILDVGANMGVWSMIPASTYGDKIRIFAFEPVPSIFETLTRNIDHNQLNASYSCHNVGIADTAGELLFDIDTENSGMGHLSTTENPEGRQIRVKTIRLADFRQEHGISKVNLVKVDVEGAEMLVLKSDEALFQSPDAPMITIEIIDEFLKRFGTSADAVKQQLQSWGYTLKYLSSGTNQLKDLPEQCDAINVHNVLAYKANHLDRVQPLL